jgi:hypothetical protein
VLFHHSSQQASPERRSTKVPLLMPRTCACLALLAVVAVVLTGCGSTTSTATTNSSVASQPQTTRAVATASNPSTTSAPGTSQVSTYSGTVTIPANSADQFTFQLTAKVTLGAASTNTEGEGPPDVNVVAPVSGTATVTNTTAGYKAEGTKIPVISILAFYRVSGPVCGPAGGLETPRGRMCSIEIASLASGCSGHEIELDSLAPEETGNLTVWPNGAQPMVNETFDPAGSAAGVAGIGGLCAHENAHPADDLRLPGLEAKAAGGVVKTLAAAPVYWVVADDTEDHNEGSTGCADTSGGNDVVDSQPSGITGCFE